MNPKFYFCTTCDLIVQSHPTNNGTCEFCDSNLTITACAFFADPDRTFQERIDALIEVEIFVDVTEFLTELSATGLDLVVLPTMPDANTAEDDILAWAKAVVSAIPQAAPTVAQEAA